MNHGKLFQKQINHTFKGNVGVSFKQRYIGQIQSTAIYLYVEDRRLCLVHIKISSISVSICVIHNIMYK